jgi:integrase
MKPVSINDLLNGVKVVYDRFFSTWYDGIESPFTKENWRIPLGYREPRGMYQLNELNGVFLKVWKNQVSKLLNLIIYTTGIGNNESRQLRVKDIITPEEYGGIHFFNIEGSVAPKENEKSVKNEFRVGIVPIHPILYNLLDEYIQSEGKEADDLLFTNKDGEMLGERAYTAAYIELGAMLGYTHEDLKNKRITFYSGRHYFNTLGRTSKDKEGNALGKDVMEMFMRHGQKKDISENYYHPEMLPPAEKREKIKQLFEIFDADLFTPKDK